MKSSKFIIFLVFLAISASGFSQSEIDKILTEIAVAPSAERIEKDIVKLAGFGTRHTLSDTISKTRGIGAARRWVKGAFDEVSKNCNL